MNEAVSIKVGIITIVYNLDPRVLILQVEAIQKFCQDDFELIVADNSSTEELSHGIKYHAERLGVKYQRYRTGTQDPSASHAFCANLAFSQFHQYYNFLLFLDHDLIPVKKFSVVEMLSGKVVGGVVQGKHYNYFWPGCLALCIDKLDIKLVNFWPNHHMHLDTGGETRILKDTYGDEGCRYFDEVGCQNPHMQTHKEYYFYMMIYYETFMHFLNSSGWRAVDKNVERINTLIDIATEKINAADANL